MDDAELMNYLEAASAVVGVPIPAAQRDGVLGFFRLAAAMAADLAAFDLPPLEEPAPMFRPGDAG